MSAAIPYFVQRHQDGSTSFLVLETEGEQDLYITTRLWPGDDQLSVYVSGQRLVATTVPPPELQDNTGPAHHPTDEVHEIEEVERRTITYRQ